MQKDSDTPHRVYFLIIRGWPYFERVGLTTGAMSVLVIAALVSGLTQATCYLIVKTYGYALGGFGLAGLIAATAIIVGMFGTPGRAIGILFSTIAVPIFLGAGLAGLDNLRRSAPACFVSTTEQQKVNLIGFPLKVFVTSPSLWR